MIYNKAGREGSAQDQNTIRFLRVLRSTVTELSLVAHHLELVSAMHECEDILEEIDAALDALGASSSASVKGGK